jgi:hypothetical protein
VREAPGEAHELALLKARAGSNLMPPLAPPKGMSMSAHFHVIMAAERLHVVEAHRLVVAEAALVWPQEVVVLDAVALEEAGCSVIHLHGEVHDDLALGLREDRREVRREVDDLRRSLEVALNDGEELVLGVFFGFRWSDLRGRRHSASFRAPPGSPQVPNQGRR